MQLLLIWCCVTIAQPGTLKQEAVSVSGPWAGITVRVHNPPLKLWPETETDKPSLYSTGLLTHKNTQTHVCTHPPIHRAHSEPCARISPSCLSLHRQQRYQGYTPCQCNETSTRLVSPYNLKLYSNMFLYSFVLFQYQALCWLTLRNSISTPQGLLWEHGDQVVWA